MSEEVVPAHEVDSGVASYNQLKTRFARMSAMRGSLGILSRDAETVMPAGAAADRDFQRETLALQAHQLLTDGKTGDLLADAQTNAANLPVDDRRNLELMQRDYDLSTKLPEDLVTRMSNLESVGERMHATQWKKSGDFAQIRDHLEQVFDAAREKGEVFKDVLGTDDAYDALLDEFEPGMRQSVIDPVFDDLKAFLTPLIPQIVDQQKKAGSFKEPSGPFPREAQEQIFQQVIAGLGLDPEKSRYDIIDGHPSCGGTPDDVRITTALQDGAFVEGLMGIIHETGHGLYEQNTPLAWRNQPIGSTLGMAMHESQSLFWEMQVGRSEAYFQYLAPILRQAFGKAATDPEYQAAYLRRLRTQVKPDFIRVEADEVTYPMHVILRYTIERALVNGKMKVDDIPEAWNQGMRDMLGITPPNHSKGCMQDIHWPALAVGYFPDYTLGAVIAAQLNEAVRGDIPDLDDHVANGDTSPALNWLRKSIHGEGQRLEMNALLQKATGGPLSTDAFKRHIEQRYLQP